MKVDKQIHVFKLVTHTPCCLS